MKIVNFKRSMVKVSQEALEFSKNHNYWSTFEDCLISNADKQIRDIHIKTDRSLINKNQI